VITWGQVDLLSAVRLWVLLESIAGNLFFRLLAVWLWLYSWKDCLTLKELWA